MSLSVEKTLKELVSLRSEAGNSMSCNLNLEVVDSFEGVKGQVYLEYESAVEHLNKQREALLREIDEKEKQALEEAKRRQHQFEEIKAEWSKLSAKVRDVEERYQTQSSIAELSDEAKTALHVELALLLLDVTKLEVKRRKLLFDIGPKLELEPSDESEDFFENESFLGSLVTKETPDFGKK